MPGIDELLANSRRFVERFPVGHLDARPSRRLAIVACMDSRLDVFGAWDSSRARPTSSATPAES